MGQKTTYWVTGEAVMSFGTICMILGAILSLAYLLFWIWLPIPEVIIKITGSMTLGGFIICIVGLFLPNNW